MCTNGIIIYNAKLLILSFVFFFQFSEKLKIELSKEEFAEAMAVKANSDFVEHFFSLIDSDRNGYISFREFLNAVVLFSKGEAGSRNIFDIHTSLSVYQQN